MDERMRATVTKKYKAAWVRDDVETADRLLATLDDKGKRQLIAWHKLRENRAHLMNSAK